jgi:glycine cleavage system H protein
MEIQGYYLPDGLYYEENHFWVKEEDGLLVLGMDDFAQKMAGEVVYIQLPDEGKIIKAQKIREAGIRQMAGEGFWTGQW